MTDPLLSTPALPAAPPAARWSDLRVALRVAWVARIAFLLFLPTAVRSLDLNYWTTVANSLDLGRNPYRTSLLNWAPFWMQWIYVALRVNQLTGINFILLIKLILILAETGVIVATFTLMNHLNPGGRFRRPLLIAFSLNPLAILLVCQHGNFDILFLLWVMLFLNALVRFGKTADGVDWLLACLWLGMGVLTKTVPLVLAPLLGPGARRLGWRATWLGAMLLAGPSFLALSVIYVLGPLEIIQHVIKYTSVHGTFGITGLLALTGHRAAVPRFARLFPIPLLIALMLIGYTFWRRQRELAAAQIVLLAGLLLIALIALGPGFGFQYLYWPIPMLAASTACGFGRWWNRLLLACLAVTALNAIAAYCLVSNLGNLLGYFFPTNPTLADWTRQLSVQAGTVPRGHILFTLPIFACLLTLLTAGSWTLLKYRPTATPAATLPV